MQKLQLRKDAEKSSDPKRVLRVGEQCLVDICYAQTTTTSSPNTAIDQQVDLVIYAWNSSSLTSFLTSLRTVSSISSIMSSTFSATS